MQTRRGRRAVARGAAIAALAALGVAGPGVAGLEVAGLGAVGLAVAAPSPLSLTASSGALAARQGRGVVGDLALRYPVGGGFGVAVVGRSGWLAAAPGCGAAIGAGACGDQGQLALLAGPTWSFAWGERRVHASALLAHVHHTALRHWQARPLANAAGDSSGDVQHRSGVELRLALTSAPWLRGSDWALAGELTAVANALPSSPQLAWGAGVQLGLALLHRPGG